MLQYSEPGQQIIPETSVSIIGIGGAGINMINRFALDSPETQGFLALAADSRTLTSTVASEKIQLGQQLTHGLGCGGDPNLGEQAAREQEQAIRQSLRDKKLVFLCVGLGGGTGSGAAPIIARIAREQNAFVVVFATMPFNFEGDRRRAQAETSLNQLSVIANALVTFDNTRMGELIVADAGVHQAFAAADRMIAESIKAVTRLVIRPGLINIGLDELITSLKAKKSRCLFGSGVASGADRAQTALKNALESPLLDKGHLLDGAETVLVHICGGESLTLYEIELLMRELGRSVPPAAQILFGAAVDPLMDDQLSITLISALPENLLTAGPTSARSSAKSAAKSAQKSPAQAADPSSDEAPSQTSSAGTSPQDPPLPSQDAIETTTEPLPRNKQETSPDHHDPSPPPNESSVLNLESDSANHQESTSVENQAPPAPIPQPTAASEPASPEPVTSEPEPPTPDNDLPNDTETPRLEPESHNEPTQPNTESPEPELIPSLEKPHIETLKHPIPKQFANSEGNAEPETSEPLSTDEPAPSTEPETQTSTTSKGENSSHKSETERRQSKGQSELELDGGPRGRFDGEEPNLFEGEDLDVPAFLRKRK